ncbi:MAG: glycosyltransferase family 2 protein [Firmicutes bacterium]|nr:glycosyltransferase family 2 protein [Bacillota bacterium]
MDLRTNTNGSNVEHPLVSIIVPVREEAENIPPLFSALASNVHADAEVLLVYDFDNDPTIASAMQHQSKLPFPLVLIRNTFGPGPANALKAAFAQAKGQAVIVLMADLSDDVQQIDIMVELFLKGYDVVCGSRYMPGGRQIGGFWLKKALSRAAGLSLRFLLGFPTHDATNSFRLYSRRLLQFVTLESSQGFELTLELTVKAWIAGLPICQIPVSWHDRHLGTSKFQLLNWLPAYLRWYFFAFSTAVRRSLGYSGDGKSYLQRNQNTMQ